MLVARFVKHQTENAVASGAKFTQDVRGEIAVKKKIASPSTLKGRFAELSNRSKDDKR